MTTTPLITYLVQHNLLTPELAETVSGTQSECELRQSLIETGVFSPSELERLEALFSGYPLRLNPPEALDAVTQSLIPLNVSRSHRLVCVDTAEGGLCVVTDQAYLPSQLEHEFTFHSIERVPAATIDQYLHDYQETTLRDCTLSLFRLAKQVRTLESFGSESMAAFFPSDHQREIAEDLAGLKLLRRLMEVVQLHGAQSLTLRPQMDKLSVTMDLDGHTQEVIAFKKELAGALYLKLRYLCDLDFSSPQTLEEGMAPGLLGEYSHTCLITFIPQALGVTMTITKAETNPDHFILSQAGFHPQDIERVMQVARDGYGLIISSGLPQSGKTFATYQVLEALACNKKTATIEDQIEYVIDGVDQTKVSRRPEKDFLKLSSHYDVIGLLPLHPGQAQTVFNQAAQRILVGETPRGVLALISRLLHLGISPGDISEKVRINIISSRFRALSAKEALPYTINSGEEATLESYCSLSELNALLGDAYPVYTRWRHIPFTTQVQKRTAWWHLRSHSPLPSPRPRYHYLRGVVALTQLISRSHREGGSLKDLEHSIKQAQKQVLAQRALVASIHGLVDVREVVAMLRS